MAQNKGMILSRSQIYENAWRDEYNPDNDPLNAHFRNIRKKFRSALRKEETYIYNIRGLGFRFGK